MQRWIVGGLIAAVLAAGGGLFAYRTYKQNRPAPVWVPLPINPKLPVAKVDEIIGNLKTKLSNEELLGRVSQDVGLTRKWNLATDEEGAREIGRRLFVRSGEADTPMGKVPAIHVGITGKRKEREVTGQIATRLMDDVFRILGINPPPKKSP